MGLLLFILANVLKVIIYPFGFVYSIVNTFFKGCLYYYKNNKQNLKSEYFYYPKFFIWIKYFAKSLYQGLLETDFYLFRCAIADDQHGNTFLAKLFNDVLIKPGGYKFGNPDETISSVLGKNKLLNKLAIAGKTLDFILQILDHNHSIKSIEHDEKN
jgi:hypothetical protein